MKNLFKLLIAFFAITTVISCNKDDDTNTDTISYKPRFISYNNYDGSTIIYDTRNTSNVKQYVYNWSNTSYKFEYATMVDTSTIGDYKHYISKYWPSTVTDPVLTGGYAVHIQDRSVGNKTYWINATNNPLYAINTSTMTDDHTNIPTAWTNAGVIDGYVLAYEYYDDSNDGYSRLFFDLNNNQYIIHRNDSIVESNTITNFVTTPLGSENSTTIDFTLADAVFFVYAGIDTRYPNEIPIYFLDYDTMQYVLVTRKRTSTTVNGKNTLRTTSWQPISNLVDSWRIDLK